MFSLQALTASTIIRNGLDLSPVVGHRTGKLVKCTQRDFRNSDTLHNRLSGCLTRVLASYPDTLSLWQDRKSIVWFAACDDLERMKLAWRVHKNVDKMEKLRLCLMGALTGPNLSCLKFVTSALPLLVDNSKVLEFVIPWIFEDNTCAHHFDSVSLSVLTEVCTRCTPLLTTTWSGSPQLDQCPRCISKAPIA